MTFPKDPRPHRPPADVLRPVEFSLYTALLLGAVIAGLTVLFRDVLPSAPWIGQAAVFAVSVAQALSARRLRGGSRRAFVLVRALSVTGTVAAGAVIAFGPHPTWMSTVLAGQLLAQFAVIVVLNRRAVRAAFPPPPRAPRTPGGRRAAMTLVFIAPLIAEFTLGTVPMAQLWLVLLYVPIYGAGVLLIRELVRRTGGGTGGILLMGLTYGLVEEGLALQSLTSPHLYGAADWGPRFLGVNLPYTELNLAYHVVFSVAIPIALVELLFPGPGRAPYLRRGGLVVTGAVALAGVVLLRLSVPPFRDPGYLLPGPAVVVLVVLIAASSVLALGILPRLSARSARSVHVARSDGSDDSDGPARSAQADRLARSDGSVHSAQAGRGGGAAVPRPLLVGAGCGIAALGFLGLLFPIFGARQPAFTEGDWVLLPMAVAALVAAGTGAVLRRWCAADGWSDRHLLAAVAGAFVAHSAFGLVANARTALDAVGLLAVSAAMVLLFAALDRRLRALPSAGSEERLRN